MADAALPGTAPLIGISSYLEQATQGAWDQRYAMVPEQYLAAVSGGGGIPILLPPQDFDDSAIACVLDAVDGLVLAGGADIDPALYGAVPGAHTQAPRHDRDAWEVALLLAALDRGLPVLAICRGVQLMNVALGGTLHQHLPDTGAADHGTEPGVYVPTGVRIADGTRVRDILGHAGDHLSVHCHHHQALDAVAPGLVVAARSSDGVVEAVELAGPGFALGVQWHPEKDAADRRLFAALVAAARTAAPLPAQGQHLPLDAPKPALKQHPVASDGGDVGGDAQHLPLDALKRAPKQHPVASDAAGGGGRVRS